MKRIAALVLGDDPAGNPVRARLRCGAPPALSGQRQWRNLGLAQGALSEIPHENLHFDYDYSRGEYDSMTDRLLE